MSQDMKSLKEQMKGLAEKKVKAYLESDLALDFKRMAEGREGQQYLWLLRECGTVMANQDWLAYSNNPDFGTISYYHPGQILGQVRGKPRLFNSRDESEQSLSQSPKHLSSIFKIIFING